MTNNSVPGFRHLQTARLQLVRTTLEHAGALFQIHGDPETVQFLPRGVCRDLEACRALLREMIAVEARGQGFRWSILLEGQVIGSLGFHAWGREQKVAQLSYELIPEARGQGYAREAVEAALGFAFAEMGLVKVVAETHQENQASRRLLQRLGFREFGGYWRIWKGGDAVWFERFELAG